VTTLKFRRVEKSRRKDQGRASARGRDSSYGIYKCLLSRRKKGTADKKRVESGGHPKKEGGGSGDEARTSTRRNRGKLFTASTVAEDAKSRASWEREGERSVKKRVEILGEIREEYWREHLAQPRAIGFAHGENSEKALEGRTRQQIASAEGSTLPASGELEALPPLWALKKGKQRGRSHGTTSGCTFCSRRP